VVARPGSAATRPSGAGTRGLKNQGGGFERIDKRFEGKLDEIPGELQEWIWQVAG
jgi:hypothetical protein